MVMSTMEHESHVDHTVEGRPEDFTKERFSQTVLQKELTSVVKEPRYKNIVHLWEFLLELLASDSCKGIICWSRKDYREFKLKNPDEVAKRWGRLKGKTGMNYEKLSRALRYYYQQGIIKKVRGQRLVYKFNRLPYEYEPGVTRSPHHLKKINASIYKEQDQLPVTLKPAQKAAGFSLVPSAFAPPSPTSPTSPICTPLSKDLSWPVLPVPTRPVLWYPSSSLFKPPPVFITRSRIMFPFVDPLTSLPLGFKPLQPMPFDTSIPVSVIQRNV